MLCNKKKFNDSYLHTQTGLWDEQDGFYYDQVRSSAGSQPLKIKSMVGLVPMFCTLVLKKQDLKHHPGFHKTIRWIIENRDDLAKNVSFKMAPSKTTGVSCIRIARASAWQLYFRAWVWY